MRRLLLLLPLLAFFTGLRAAIPFAQSESDLKPDPTALFGTLPNGLRYVIRPNHEPKNRASLRLVVQAGSFNEKPDQQGLAHFLEHMAFNGSSHFAPGTLVEFLQRMGMSFGADTNASTSFDRTIYQLELPDTKPTTLNEGLQVFADYAGSLLLRPQDINKERGIILSEKRTRDSVDYRTIVSQLGFELKGSLLPDRWPIGKASIIENAQRPQFVDFYNTWYRPKLLSVVVVGDIDPAAVEKQIVAMFSPLAPRAPARPAPDLGHLDVAGEKGVLVFHHAEAEAPNTTVSIGTIRPYHHEPDTGANRLKYLPRSLADAMIDRRLSILAKKENAPFIDGTAEADESFDFYHETAISLDCRADQWRPALAVADQELRRALEHGFEPAELREVVANFRNSLDQAVKTAATRRSEALAGEIADSLVDRNVFTTPAEDEALYGPALDQITVADCLAALREAWAAPHRLVMVTGNAVIPGDDLAAIRDTYEQAHAVPVAPPAAIAEQKWAYTNFGPAGQVVKREHIPDLDVTLVQFANGVRLNLKKTNFEANRIRINLRVGNGKLTQPPDEPGLAAYTGQTFVAGGLGQHSEDDLRMILAGHTVGSSFSAGGDAFISQGITNRDDLLLELQLMTARITDPGYRPEAARQARKAIQELYLSLAHTIDGPFTLDVPKILSSGDPRFGLPPENVMLQRNLAEEKAWLTPELQHGYIEIAIVGDLDIDATIQAVARTFGALPPRDPRQPLAALHQVHYPAHPFARDYAIPTEIPKGTVVIYWPTTDALEIHRSRRLTLLGLVLSDRLRVKVREQLGDAYSPDAGNDPSDVYPGYGYMLADVIVDPPRAQQVADAVVGVATALSTQGVTADELARAKLPVLTQLRESARTNQYWIGAVLNRAQERPQQLDWCRTRYSDIESITTADLDALAKTYLQPDRASRVIVVPERKPVPPATGPVGPTNPSGPATPAK
ncbi:MAG TPA: insulinase family protein [Opitutaceae bacterium]|nr:insulinase family protein [Opitutaceae bacterium]